MTVEVGTPVGVLVLVSYGIVVLWAFTVVLCAFMIWRGKRRAARTARIAASSQPIEPVELVPRDVCCCFCQLIIPGSGNPAQPLDPCAIILVGHFNKRRAEQKEMRMYCHFECFRRATDDLCLAMTDPEFWTVGRSRDQVDLLQESQAR